MKKENIKYFLLALFFMFILFLSPISGDDWGNYIEGSQGIRHIFGNAIGMYFDWEGRFISRILINLLTYHKILWNIVNSLMMVGIIYYTVNLINPKNKKLVFTLSTLVVLMMNIFTFSQVVVWVAGNITYLFVIPMMLYYFYQILRDEKCTKLKFSIYIFLNIIIPMFVEHMAVILVIGNILILIYKYIKNKKIDKQLLVYLLFSIISLIAMLFSPGSIKRSQIENTEFNKLSIMGKIAYNLPNFIYYTYFIYPYLTLLSTIGNYHLLKSIKNKYLRFFSYIYLLLIPIIITSVYILSEFTRDSLQLQNSVIVILYFITYTIITFILICLYSKKQKSKNAIFFYILAISANLVMLLSPTWGYRTSFGTYVFLSIAYIEIIDKSIIENKLIDAILLIVSIVMFIFYTILYISVARQYRENLNTINTSKKSNVIEIRKYPSFVNCNINPSNPYHMKRFKEYFNIPESAEVKIIDNNWKYLIFYKSCNCK